jgi:hypothetical protein
MMFLLKLEFEIDSPSIYLSFTIQLVVTDIFDGMTGILRTECQKGHVKSNHA